jgi:hypothetical protein
MFSFEVLMAMKIPTIVLWVVTRISEERGSS